MFIRKGIIVGLIMLGIICISAGLLSAAPGDCDGDGNIAASDAVALVNYLFAGGTLTNPSDCDCDGHPGISIGDALQLFGAMFTGCNLFPSPGTDLAVPSQVKLYFNGRVDFGVTPPMTSIDIEVDVPAGFDVEAFYIPFSFAADPGGQVLDVANIDLTGTVAADISASLINNTDKYFALGGGTNGTITALPGGTHGKLCTVNFNLASSPTDDPTSLRMSTTDRIEPLLFHQVCYSGIDRRRVYLAEFMRAPYGDVNTDRSVNVSDAVYIINFVFVGGPRPGNLEPWH